MTRGTGLLVLAAAGALLAGAARAETATIDIATSQAGTLFYSMAAAVAKVVSGGGEVRALVRPYGGGSQWMPLLDRGEVSTGLASAIDTDDAGRGVGSYEGRPHPNIRVAGAMAPLLFSMFVRADTAPHTVAELKGLRIPTEYPNGLVVVRAMTAYLAAANLSFADFRAVPTSGLMQNASDFKLGRVDIGTLPVGAGGLAEVNAEVRGGIRYVDMDASPAALARARKVLPYVYTLKVQPSPVNVGVHEPITVLAYDTYILFNKDVPDATVYAVVKAVHQNKQALAAAFPWFRDFDPARMAKSYTVAYHPGAVKYFTEKGMWPPRE